jgi:hypothetical protein
MWTNELSNQSICIYIFFFLCKSFANVATFQMADEQRAVPVLEFGEILNSAISDLLIASGAVLAHGRPEQVGFEGTLFCLLDGGIS